MPLRLNNGLINGPINLKIWTHLKEMSGGKVPPRRNPNPREKLELLTLGFLTFLEPSIHDDGGIDIMHSLCFDKFLANSDSNSKIWIFSKFIIQVDFVDSFSQGLTVLLLMGFLVARFSSLSYET